MKIPIRARIKLAAISIPFVLKKPTYFFIAVLSAFIMGFLIIWSLNLELLRFIIFEAPISTYEKFDFFIDGYTGLFSSYDNILSLGIIFFTITFGINTALLIFVIKHYGAAKIPKKSNGIALIAAIIGGGCVACGTSILTPLLISVGLVGAPLVRDLSTILNWIGVVLLVYSILKLSQIIATIIAKERSAN